MSGEIHALSGAYAVDALDELERGRFERHLDQCSTCRDEVDSLREAAAYLSSTGAPTTAPLAMRMRVLHDISSIRPMPPVVVRADDLRRASRRRFPALVAAAAALIVVGGVGATAWHPWSKSTTTTTTTVAQTVSPKVQAILTAADAVPFSKSLDGGGSAKVVVSRSKGGAVVMTSGLPALPANRVYEVWLQTGVLRPAGYIHDTNDPVILQGDVNSATGVGISIEKRQGATVPGDLIGTISLAS